MGLFWDMDKPVRWILTPEEEAAKEAANAKREAWLYECSRLEGIRQNRELASKAQALTELEANMSPQQAEWTRQREYQEVVLEKAAWAAYDARRNAMSVEERRIEDMGSRLSDLRLEKTKIHAGKVKGWVPALQIVGQKLLYVDSQGVKHYEDETLVAPTTNTKEIERMLMALEAINIPFTI